MKDNITITKTGITVDDVPININDKKDDVLNTVKEISQYKNDQSGFLWEKIFIGSKFEVSFDFVDGLLHQIWLLPTFSDAQINSAVMFLPFDEIKKLMPKVLKELEKVYGKPELRIEKYLNNTSKKYIFRNDTTRAECIFAKGDGNDYFEVIIMNDNEEN